MRRGRANDPGLHVRDVELVADDDPEVLAGRAELVQALGEALLELPATDRAVLLLAEAEDWTGPEIAAKLGTTPNAVRTRLSRARGLNRRYRRRIMQYSRPRMAHGGRGLPPWTSTSALPEANA
jgi:DNA-directed RNA polymerase specialized sigma24 family protein